MKIDPHTKGMQIEDRVRIDRMLDEDVDEDPGMKIYRVNYYKEFKYDLANFGWGWSGVFKLIKISDLLAAYDS